MLGKLALAGLGLIGLASLGARRRKPKEPQMCVVNFKTGKIRAKYPSLRAATRAEADLPMASHYLTECQPGWRVGMKVSYY